MTQVPTADATVTYKGSIQRLDGGWDTAEIVLPVGATDTHILEAVEQWQRTRDLTLPVLQQLARQVAPSTPAAATSDDPGALMVTFGKYRDRTLGEIWQQDSDYVAWLAGNARDRWMRDAAQAVIDAYHAAGGHEADVQEEERTAASARWKNGRTRSLGDDTSAAPDWENVPAADSDELAF